MIPKECKAAGGDGPGMSAIPSPSPLAGEGGGEGVLKRSRARERHAFAETPMSSSTNKPDWSGTRNYDSQQNEWDRTARVEMTTCINCKSWWSNVFGMRCMAGGAVASESGATVVESQLEILGGIHGRGLTPHLGPGA